MRNTDRHKKAHSMEGQRKRYSFFESYTILYQGFRTLKYFSKAKKSGTMNTEFMERIMLAVTEVNGCPLCSYAHTNLALESGMSNEEIQKLLSGDLEKIPLKELPAILFSQHYAESRGKPNLESWNRIVEIYGNQLALGILGAIRMIMMGNAFGLVLSSLQGRFKRNSDTHNPLFYELGMLLLFLPFLLISIPHRLISFIAKRPIITFV